MLPWCLVTTVGSATHGNSKILISFPRKLRHWFLQEMVTHASLTLLPAPCCRGRGLVSGGPLQIKLRTAETLAGSTDIARPIEGSRMKFLGRDKSSRIPQYSPLLPRSLTSNY